MENYTASLGHALERGVIQGSAGEGRISAATRAGYAAACVAVLTSAEDQAGRTYELGGDAGFTMAEYAAELSRLSGKTVTWRNLPVDDYASALAAAGLAEGLARMLAESDGAIASGALFDDSHELSRLIGRPTITLDQAISTALAA